MKKKKKKSSLTQLQLVGIKEEKMERRKSFSTSGHDLKPSPRNPLKVRFKKKMPKKQKQKYVSLCK